MIYLDCCYRVEHSWTRWGAWHLLLWSRIQIPGVLPQWKRKLKGSLGCSLTWGSRPLRNRFLNWWSNCWILGTWLLGGWKRSAFFFFLKVNSARLGAVNCFPSWRFQRVRLHLSNAYLCGNFVFFNHCTFLPHGSCPRKWTKIWFEHRSHNVLRGPDNWKEPDGIAKTSLSRFHSRTFQLVQES